MELRSRPTTVVALNLVLALAVNALESAPPEMPTPEQIEQVTGTKTVERAEDVYVGDTMSVNATQRREMAYRTLAVALERDRSDKADAADELVCRKLAPVGSHITRTYCATNRTWNYIRKQTTRSVYGDVGGAIGPGYTLTEGPVFAINPSVLAKLGDQFEGQDHAGRLAQLAAEEAVGRMSDEWSTPTETVTRFARAFGAVAHAAEAGDAVAQERAMASAIADHGFTIEQYNDLVGRLEASGLFQRRVAAATQAFKL